MRLNRFYIPNGNLGKHFEKFETFLISNENIIHQIRTVFRFQGREEIILFDGGEYDFLCEIEDDNKKISRRHEPIKINVKEKIKNKTNSKIEIILFQSLIKKDNFELVAQKATELGASKIVPVISERSEKKAINLERIKKIMIEATEQSGRSKIPSICAAVSLSDSFKSSSNLKFALNLEGQWFHNVIGGLKNNKEPVSIFIGPEGGWSDNDLKILKENSVEIVSLGEGVLRSETAAIAILSLLLL